MDDQTKQYIDQQIASKIQFSNRIVSDTPTDMLSVVNKKYVLNNGGASIIGAKGDLIVGSNTSVLGRLPVGSDGSVLYADSTQSLGIKWDSNYGGFFGDGSDGNVTINLTTTLTRDMYYNNLTIGTGNINTAGFQIFVKGTLTITSPNLISNNGTNGTNGGNANGSTGGTGGNGGSGAPSGNLSGGVSGVSGSTGANGVGAGAGSGLTPNAGAGGNSTSTSIGSSGTSGASGGGGGTSGGFGGGGGGGGGAGGTGGAIILVYKTLTQNGSFQVNGGGGGSGGTFGTAHANGAIGNAGSNGSTGNAGIIWSYQIS